MKKNMKKNRAATKPITVRINKEIRAAYVESADGEATSPGTWKVVLAHEKPLTRVQLEERLRQEQTKVARLENERMHTRGAVTRIIRALEETRTQAALYAAGDINLIRNTILKTA